MYAVMPLRSNSGSHFYPAGTLVLADLLERESISPNNWPEQCSLFGAWALPPESFNYEAAVEYVKMAEPSHILVFIGSGMFYLGQQYVHQLVMEF